MAQVLNNNIVALLKGHDGAGIYTTESVLATEGTGTISRTAVKTPTGRSVNVGDLILDAHGTLVYVNSATVSDVGYEYFTTIGTAGGTLFFDIIPDETNN